MSVLSKSVLSIAIISQLMISCSKSSSTCTYQLTEKVYNSSGTITKNEAGGTSEFPCSKGDYFEERVDNIGGCSGCDNTFQNDIVREYRKK